jgi:hypothetical protein
MIYVLTAKSVSKNFDHSYVVGVFDSEDKLLEVMEKEETYRDRKYSFSTACFPGINHSIHECFYADADLAWTQEYEKNLDAERESEYIRLTKYKRQTLEGDQEQSVEPIKGSTGVFISLNDETGEIYYSVALKSDPAYWIDSFYTLRDAEDFISFHAYSYDKEKDFAVNLCWENSRNYDRATRSIRPEGAND